LKFRGTAIRYTPYVEFMDYIWCADDRWNVVKRRNKLRDGAMKKRMGNTKTAR